MKENMSQIIGAILGDFQIWHYSYTELDNSLLWAAVLCPVGYLAGTLAAITRF